MISADQFYGVNKNKTNYLKSNTSRSKSPIPFKSFGLREGPPTTWRVFKKQNDALDFARKKGFGLMTFAFESDDSRLFLVAHPEVFWHYDSQRSVPHRSSYEIIPEFTVCKLYFDLEYDILCNPEIDGLCIVDTFIQIVSFFFYKIYKIKVQTEDVLVLNSTISSVKFSEHLIYNIPLVVFLNNYEAGAFARFICREVTKSVEDNALTEILADCEVSLEKLKSLLVKDKKGNLKIFCDECVYSKNRHFRLFGSSKKGKNSPLLIRGIQGHYLSEKDIFLKSLVSFVNDSDAMKVLQFNMNMRNVPPKSENFITGSTTSASLEKVSRSPFPEVDNFISSLISPGKIYRSAYFSSSNVIVFDIVGFRYCGNIGRSHKSNNIKYIVDLTNLNYYQKCHDYECSGFKSEKMNLPYELCFLLSDNSDILETNESASVGSFGISNEDFEGYLDLIEDIETSIV